MHMHVLERVRPGARVAGPENIELPTGYTITPVASNLNYPTSVSWDPDGNMLIAESRLPFGRSADTPSRILRLTRAGCLEPVIAGLAPFISDITVYRGMLYVSHQGRISVIEDGRVRDLITGLPSWGLHQNSTIVFGPDEHLYFGQGSVSNAGVIGPTELARLQRTGKLDSHDIPGAPVILTGRSYPVANPVTGETRPTGAFSPWGMATSPGERRAGPMPGQAASAAIMRANLDGSDLRVHAWGLRAPVGLASGPDHRLYVTNQAARPWEPRPVVGDLDALWIVEEGVWYGWPDYFLGEPVSVHTALPAPAAEREFLIANHGELLRGRGEPPKPLVTLGAHAMAGKFDFCLHPSFGFAGQIFVAEMGPLQPPREEPAVCLPEGHRVVRVDLAQGTVSDLAINRSRLPASQTGNNGGLERPIEAKFGPDGSLYIVDFGVIEYREDLQDWVATEATGIVWQVTRTG